MKGIEAMNHRRPFPLGRLVLLTLPLLLAVATPVRAQHQVTTSRMYPITGGHTYYPPTPCSCLSGPSDFVTLSGVIHVLTQVTPGPTGTIETHANLIDVTGVGATGCPYRAVGAARLASNSPPFQIFTGTYDLIPPPSCPHTPIQVNGEIVFNPDGTQADNGSSFTFDLAR
jgi:hypothetical protein